VKNEESPVSIEVSASTSRLRGNAYKGAEAPASLKNPIVAVAKPNGAGKPNGHALAKRAAVK
jgi:hypothetical protein